MHAMHQFKIWVSYNINSLFVSLLQTHVGGQSTVVALTTTSLDHAMSLANWFNHIVVAYWNV